MAAFLSTASASSVPYLLPLLYCNSSAPLRWRKLSWAIGGDPDYATTFNMFKYFNPNVVGGPVDNTIPFDAVNMQKGIVRAPRLTLPASLP